MYGKALTAVLLLQAASVVLAQQSEEMKTGSEMAVTQETFVKKAASDGMTEVVLARLAMEKSQDPQIRQFAQRMMKDHTLANKQLKAAAAQEGMDLPANLDPEHEELVQKLKGLDGAEFDSEYRKHMEQDHNNAVALFQSATQSTQMAEPIRQFAASTLPTLQEHQQMAEELVEGANKSSGD